MTRLSLRTILSAFLLATGFASAQPAAKPAPVPASAPALPAITDAQRLEFRAAQVDYLANAKQAEANWNEWQYKTKPDLEQKLTKLYQALASSCTPAQTLDPGTLTCTAKGAPPPVPAVPAHVPAPAPAPAPAPKEK